MPTKHRAKVPLPTYLSRVSRKCSAFSRSPPHALYALRAIIKDNLKKIKA